MSKAPYSLKQQISKLEGNGLAVPDAQVVARLLYDNNYYRLSGYWRYMQVNPQRGVNTFTAGTSVAQVEEIYRFDAGLRSILLEGIAEVEIALRSRLAYQFAMSGADECSYLDPAHYSSDVGRNVNGDLYAYRDELIASIERDLGQSKEHFVASHRQRGLDIPIWVAVETMSFGTVSKMYKLLVDQDIRHAVRKSFSLPSTSMADSIFHSISTLRNICAHHGRIWNRVPARATPVLNQLKSGDRSMYERSPWGWMTILAFLADDVRKDTSFSTDLWGHVNAYPLTHPGLQYPHSR